MATTTDLGKWMITNGGVYDPEAAYEQLTMVVYDNSTYITLKTVQGVTPIDDHVNYQLMAKGFDPTALGSVQAEDTSGVLGEVGGTVSAQDLVDWVVDQAATKLLKISDLVSVQTNDKTKGVSAALAYSMNQSITQLYSDLDLKLNNTCIFVNKGEDFGRAIKNSGIVKWNRIGFFICNSPSNSPLGTGFIILAHNNGYWKNHPTYIKTSSSDISYGTLDCSDYTNIIKD